MGAIASQLTSLTIVLNRLFRRRSKKTSKLPVTGLCAGNSPGTGEFPAQMASNAENVSIWWRHDVRPSDTLIHQYTGTLLFKIKVCRPFGANQYLNQCWVVIKCTIGKFQWNMKLRKYNWICCLKHDSHFDQASMSSNAPICFNINSTCTQGAMYRFWLVAIMTAAWEP